MASQSARISWADPCNAGLSDFVVTQIDGHNERCSDQCVVVRVELASKWTCLDNSAGSLDNYTQSRGLALVLDSGELVH